MERTTVNKMNVEDAAWVSRLVAALEEFRKLNQDVTANQIITFLTIGLNPGISQRELSEKVGLKGGSVSRIAAILSERGNRGVDGLKLIDIRQVPGDYRTTGQHLAPKGARVWEALRRIMKGR